MAFSSDSFGDAEFENIDEICSSCRNKYEIAFSLMKKVIIKSSNNHEVYKWLTDKLKNGKFNSVVDWNFQKSLITKMGS